jgi:hypothetical protein
MGKVKTLTEFIGLPTTWLVGVPDGVKEEEFDADRPGSLGVYWMKSKK